MTLGDKLDQRVARFVARKRLIDAGDAILAGFSGGADSTFLLDWLWRFRRKYRVEVGAAHVDHRLRGEESDADARACRAFCEERGIPFFLERVEPRALASERGLSLEEACRELRYDAFERIAAREGFTKIATGHNLSDLAETTLFRFLKGAGLAGLGGVAPKRGKVIRPALDVAKEDIRAALEERDAAYALDSTNADFSFPRNAIRREIIPVIRARVNPSFERATARSAELAAETTRVFEARIVEPFRRKATSFVSGTLRFSIDAARDEEDVVAREALRGAVRDGFGAELGYDDLARVIELAEKQTGASLSLPEGIRATRDRIYILIERIADRPTLDDLEVELAPGEIVALGDVRVSTTVVSTSEASVSEDPRVEYVDAERFAGAPRLRRSREGETFTPLGMRGVKKLSDFLTDEKVPTNERARQTVVADDRGVVWVVGRRIAERVKITEETKTIWRMETFRA